MGTVVSDLRYSVRALLKQPGFALVAVASLALGIGANTTIFSLLNAVFLNPLPVERASELAAVYTIDANNEALGLSGMSFPNYEDFRDQNESFSGLAAWGFPLPTAMMLDEEPEQVLTELVSGNYFEVLGVRPALGRFLAAEDDVNEGGHPVAVMSYALWSRRFGRDPSVLDTPITLNGVSYDILGVAPEGFKGVNSLFSSDLWVPMAMFRQVLPAQFHEWFDNRRALFLNVGGRLSDGVSLSQAQANMRTVASALESEYPEPNKGRSVELRPITEATIFPGVRNALLQGGIVLMTIVGLVLLIACFNVANLLLARASARRKEVAVRLSLGAGRLRLARQLLTESVLLAVVGGAAGMLVARWGLELIWSLRPAVVGQNMVQPALDAQVLLFALVLSLATGVLFGLAPALQSSRAGVVDALKEETRTAGRAGGRMQLRNLLVVGQVALSIVSLVAAGLFLRSLGSAHAIDPGFDTERLAVMTVNVGQAGHSRPQGEQFYDRVLEELGSDPTVRSVAWASNLPMFGGFQRSVFVEGRDAEDEVGVLVMTNNVDPGYFETVGTALLRGRDFTSADREGSRHVAIVNEKMAEDFWPGTEAVGKRFRFYGDGFFTEIVGIVETAKYTTLGEPPTAAAFLARRQGYADVMVLHVGARNDPTTALAAAQRIVREIDGRVPTTTVFTIGEVIDQSLWPARLGATLLGVFGMMALVLASVGLYGVMAYQVNQRNQEIGLRMALGAASGDVLGMILKQSMTLVGIGTLIGLGAAFAVSYLIQAILYGSAQDPLTFVGVPLALVGVALVASLLPALRASRVDPLVALRYE
jgi:predicted permease